MRRKTPSPTTLAALLALLASPAAWAAAPGVPALPSTPADYVSHAVTNLPDYYATGAVAAANNTPADNPITNAGAELGRVLFYDTRLSHNDGKSCASCHSQSAGFGDTNQFSEGFEGGLTGRHSPGLTNAMFYQRGRFFWDERAATLEEQVLGPIQDPVEMGSTLDEVEAKLAATEFYPQLFERAFGDSEVTSDRISKSMAQFVRSMVSYESKFDRALQAGPPGSPGFRNEFTPQENQGHAIFAQDCGRCHGTSANIATRPENIGLDPDNTEDNGVNGRFKVASLRNIAERGRYMHDGSMESLEEVIEHYSSGIEANPRLSPGLPVGGFNYTQGQKDALLAFLHTLSDEAFLSSELFSDPFVTLNGDYNGDGVVDMDDYLVWRQDFGSLASDDPFAPLMADGNNDGVVDSADFSIWRDNLGARWDDAVLAVAAAPEPASAMAIGVAALLLTGRRPRRRGRGLLDSPHGNHAGHGKHAGHERRRAVG